MQGSELKDVRTSLGLSQAQFGSALGMTPKYVGMMERGEAPIEPRTEQAIRWLDDGGGVPLHVTVGPLGDEKYLVFVTRALPGHRRRLHCAEMPVFDTHAEAAAAAHLFAEKHNCRYIVRP